MSNSVYMASHDAKGTCIVKNMVEITSMQSMAPLFVKKINVERL